MKRIKITAGNVKATAALGTGAAADAIWAALPISARGARWGKEIYFAIPVHATDQNRSSTVKRGDLGYWEPGHAFCIFWGPTPASRGNEIRPASSVTVFGHIEGDADVFDSVASGEPVKVERLA